MSIDWICLLIVSDFITFLSAYIYRCIYKKMALNTYTYKHTRTSHMEPGAHPH